MIISLIGYRGSGKTSVADALAQRLDCMWADADQILEEVAECSIREIFEHGGERRFRRIERAVIARMTRFPRLILATGGGAILNRETRRRLRRSGPVVWLTADVDTLAHRIAADTSTAERRPNLTTGGVAEIQSLLKTREPLYRQTASFSVSTANRNIDEIADDIALQLPPRCWFSW